MDSGFLRTKAARCRHLADIAGNREIRDALDELARELDEAAGAVEADRQDAERRRRDGPASR
jgi:hypothetical protein